MAIKLLCNNKNISNYVSSITWSGSNTEVSRKIEIQLINPITINCGDNIIFYEDSTELFRGHVFVKNKTQSQKVLNNTTYDSLIYLKNSTGTYNFKNITPEGITKKLCSDFNIPIGNVASTNINCKFLFKEKSIYTIMMTAYTKVENITGCKYIPIMQHGKLNIIIKGAKVISYNSNYITDTQNTESIENMVNRIKAYDDKGNYIGMIENTDWIKRFGVLQSVQTIQNKNVRSLKNMLKGIEKTVSMDGIGNVNCITGNAIKIKVANGISGLFFIDADTHTWSNGVHTMQLTLNYQNLMDEQSDNDNSEESPTVQGKKSRLNSKKAAKAAQKAIVDAQAKKDAEAAIKLYGG